MTGMEALLGPSIEDLLSLDPRGLDDDELHAVVMAHQQLLSRFAVVRSRCLAEWEQRGTWALDRSRTAAARLSRESGCSPETAKTELRRARRLRTMPSTEAGLADGSLSVDRADLLVAANTPERAATFTRDELVLVTNSAELPRFAEFARTIAHWRNLADDEGCERRAERDRDRRHVTVRRRRDGMVQLEALLDAATGAAFTTELDRLDDDLYRHDWAEAKAEHGDQMCTDKLPRRPQQRRCDALAQMASRSGAMPANARRPRPLFTVLIGYETLAGRVCELADGTVLTPGQAATMLTEADIERIVFEGKSRVIDVGRRTRAFPGALRRAIQVRDRHCSIPGCDVPADRCQVDHIVEYTDGGDTTQDNGRLLCPTHNRQRPGRTSPPVDGP